MRAPERSCVMLVALRLVRVFRVGVLAVIFAVSMPSAPDAWAGSSDTSRVPLVLEARLVAGPDQCPKTLQVWLASTPDTIQGFEIYLAWDRPDFARFVTVKPSDSLAGGHKLKSGSKESTIVPGNTALRPQVSRAEGLAAKWEYFEARGDNGLSAKVVGLAYLLSNTRPRPIVPGDSGLLFSLPLVVSESNVGFVDGDSSIVRLDNMLTRLSDTKGNLIKQVVLRDAIVHVAPCRTTTPKK